MYETFNYVMGYVRNIHAASTKFLSCWSHHKLRLQRPMAARNHYRHLQYDSYDPLGTGTQPLQCQGRKQTGRFVSQDVIGLVGGLKTPDARAIKKLTVAIFEVELKNESK